MNYRPVFYMMVGVPGSGKSTRLKQIVDREARGRTYVENQDYVILSTDRYIEAYAKEVGKDYNEVFKDKIGEAEMILNDMLNAAVKAGMDIYWDQTNLSVKGRAKKLAKIPENYHKNAIVIERTDEELSEQLKKRVAEGGKFIADKIVDDMKKTYQRPTCAEGFDVVFFCDSGKLVQSNDSRSEQV